MTNNTTKHVQMPKTFDTAEFEARLEKAKAEYLEGRYEHNRWIYPAAVVESVPTLQMLLELVIQKEKEGQSLYPHGDPAEGMVGYYRVMLWKPKEEIESDLTALKAKVEADLKAEVMAFNTEQENLLAEQLYQAQLAKEKKAVEEKDRKAREAARKEASEYFASLNKKEGK